ncbi:MAG TPA: histidine kinase [Thermoanaerobaculia bacterium]|nr:histidine kinase [Thermoanaerobaculia bacterium]
MSDKPLVTPLLRLSHDEEQADAREVLFFFMRWKRILFVFAAVTAVGLLNFSVVETSWLSEGNAGPAKYPFVWEMTGVYTFLLLLPLLVLVINRFPLQRRNLLTRIPLHIVTFLLFAVSHTLLMWGSRALIYRLLGWGTYDYGAMRYRFLMEGQKQLIIYIALYCGLRFLAYARANRERDAAASRLERELTEARLSALKMQLQPHFLFNALNMIASHVSDEPEIAGAMLEHLSNFLRATLRASASQEVPLREEIEFLGSYLSVMKARFEQRLCVDISLPPSVSETLVPHLLLQPLVENSITHSLNDHARRAEIRVAARRVGDHLEITIEDNGPGIAPDAIGNGRGIGLSNTMERLQHLYGERHRFGVLNRPEGGLRLTIELPWHTAGETAA